MTVFDQSGAVQSIADNPQMSASPTTVTITQVTGRGAVLELTGRCLPFAPVDTVRAQRTHRSVYPGSTEASIQVLGWDPGPGEMHGTFATRYMSGADLFRYEEKKGGSATRVDNAEWARKILFDVCREGQEVEIHWGMAPFGITERAVITKVRCPETRAQDIEWHIEYEILADQLTAGALLFQAPDESPQGLLDKVENLLSTLQTVADEAQGAYREYILGTINRIEDLREDVENLVQTGFDLAASPAQAARSAATVANNCKQMLVDIQAGGLGVVAQYSGAVEAWQGTGDRIAFLPWTATGDVPDTDASAEIRRVNEALSIQHSAVLLRHEASRAEQRYLSDADLEIRAFYRVNDGDTLRGISVREYGTADNWRLLAERNDLASDDLSEGMFLIIPEVR